MKISYIKGYVLLNNETTKYFPMYQIFRNKQVQTYIDMNGLEMARKWLEETRRGVEKARPIDIPSRSDV